MTDPVLRHAGSATGHTPGASYGSEWLSWWHYECNLGKTPLEAYRSLGTKALRVSTLERLATVICWGMAG